LEIKSESAEDRLLTDWARCTGIGIDKECNCRALTGGARIVEINPASSDTTLDLKPLTASWLLKRIHPALASSRRSSNCLAISRAGFWVQPVVERVTNDQDEFLKWISPDGLRRIVLLIDGSTAIVGNDERAVSACLAARRGQRPNLAHQPDVEDMRDESH